MLLKFPWNNPVVENAPLRPVSSAAGSHSVAARDHFEIESLLDVLSQPWPVSLEDNRVLEFSCGRIRIPFLIAAAGHQDDLSAHVAHAHGVEGDVVAAEQHEPKEGEGV